MGKNFVFQLFRPFLSFFFKVTNTTTQEEWEGSEGSFVFTCFCNILTSLNKVAFQLSTVSFYRFHTTPKSPKRFLLISQSCSPKSSFLFSQSFLQKLLFSKVLFSSHSFFCWSFFFLFFCWSFFFLLFLKGHRGKQGRHILVQLGRWRTRTQRVKRQRSRRRGGTARLPSRLQ